MTIRIDSATDLVTMTRAEYEALLEAVEDAEDMARLAALEERGVVAADVKGAAGRRFSASAPSAAGSKACVA